MRKLALALCLTAIAVPAQARNAEDCWCGKGKNRIHLMMWIAKVQEPMRHDAGKIDPRRRLQPFMGRVADGRTYSQYGIIHPKRVTVVPKL
jgi:hypothetical protein